MALPAAHAVARASRSWVRRAGVGASGPRARNQTALGRSIDRPARRVSASLHTSESLRPPPLHPSIPPHHQPAYYDHNPLLPPAPTTPRYI
ncbi:hypothetical protein HYPSUDRAFT_43156 [Hypholoma sublateritium FD-334 SS-4]|uniref:Uncharacterized protein n=1 Tax=Hypholoma sublateritium (strain FD-334 SS-4) TaxID=945553 RepID=A0A0D2MAQ6_HYPSF|nr:hypothetical protein HYPSUDRAFT_43156 [Hypholoma sublateritium FD-334 SS-4]